MRNECVVRLMDKLIEQTNSSKNIVETMKMVKTKRKETFKVVMFAKEFNLRKIAHTSKMASQHLTVHMQMVIFSAL